MKKAEITGCPSNGRLDFNSCKNCPNYGMCVLKAYEEKNSKKSRSKKSLKAKIAIFCSLVLVMSFLLSAIASLETEAANTEKTASNNIENEETFIEAEKEKQEPTMANVEEMEEETRRIQETIESAIQETENVEETLETMVEEAIHETELAKEYKPLKISLNISAHAPYNYFVYKLSEEDMLYIAMLVWAEARGECYEGKVAVAAVVLNRYFSENEVFDRESILSVIKQSAQFASISNVTMWDLEQVPDCYKAVEDACRGWDPTREVFEEGALYFYNPAGVYGYQASVREGIKVMVIGNHNFHYDFEKVE